ncbi:MAG: alanine--tRNA ligase [Capsulimonadaceae bacterium]|nr:alanine--tRNA ligase [Capsulimonadaceae bacterium]
MTGSTMLGSQLRQQYLDFFVGKGAKQLPSDSLVPNDPTLLFTSAGMVQFKPYFLGEQTPPSTRATTCQKCLRTTDIEEVGDTSHCTFFEMLGNFSFGDYFKPEVIPWAWEFLFDVLKLDLNRVRVTVFTDDDDAYGLWVKAGMPENKIFRFGEKSNYWPANAITEGPNGPCGPCSEIFFDTRPDLPPTPDGVWDDKRWLEIWNLVFMQFERHDGGRLTPLPKKNIDTGMGLERTAAVLNDLRGPFETDLFAPTLARLQELTGKTYTHTDDARDDIAFRRIADHVRATAFCLGDGVLPSNVGRGYVLRRIMRRAILAGRNILGYDGELLVNVIPTIVEQYAQYYPELVAKNDIILRYASIEERQFRRTLDAGTQRLEALLSDIPKGGNVSGEDAFTLFATFGFPLEMTVELASEYGVGVDRERFEVLLEEHARVSHGGREREVMLVNAVVPKLRDAHVPESQFVGYDSESADSRISAIIVGNDLVKSASEGQTVRIVLNRTPFYAESGGQVGDLGRLAGEGFEATVSDTRKEGGFYFHEAEIVAGSLSVGDAVTAHVDSIRRQAIRRNHSSTHLLHKALQLVLGDHVQQRGSLVGPDKLRFDFSHDKALTADELRQVEALVNEKILSDLPVDTLVKPIDEAREMGAMMLFGEKYGATVRVVRVGDYSIEFCGGTHLSRTSQAGIFKITSEGSSQAGVRRIEAVTGEQALLKTLDQERILQEVSGLLKTPPALLATAVEKLQADLRSREKELSALQKAASGGLASELATSALDIGGFKLVAKSLGESADADSLRSLADDILDRLKSGVVVLAGSAGGRVALAVKVSKNLIDDKGLNAGQIVKAAAAACGGGGGGRPDFAQAGGKDPARIVDALAAAETLIREKVGA